MPLMRARRGAGANELFFCASDAIFTMGAGAVKRRDLFRAIVGVLVAPAAVIAAQSSAFEFGAAMRRSSRISYVLTDYWPLSSAIDLTGKQDNNLFACHMRIFTADEIERLVESKAFRDALARLPS
jgi:hypothetical protein